jgi:HEAT repeats/PBS lyase HEAT-like repeat
MGYALRAGKRRTPVNPRDRRKPGSLLWRCWLPAVLAAACLGASGCGAFWDDLTRRDFQFKRLYTQPDPLVVLRDSQDADDRARAMRALQHEPLQNGGDQHDQDIVVQLLTTAAVSDHQIVCRQAAVFALRDFKDPRAVKALKDAYYAAGSFNPESATILRCQVLSALGTNGQPEAVELLVRVLKEPPVEGASEDKEAKMDERTAAARSLKYFKEFEATSALAGVLRTDQDVALRNRATESLHRITGKDLPAEYQPWADYLNQVGKPDALEKEKAAGNGFSLASWWSKK